MLHGDCAGDSTVANLGASRLGTSGSGGVPPVYVRTLARLTLASIEAVSCTERRSQHHCLRTTPTFLVRPFALESRRLAHVRFSLTRACLWPFAPTTAPGPDPCSYDPPEAFGYLVWACPIFDGRSRLFRAAFVAAQPCSLALRDGHVGAASEFGTSWDVTRLR